MAGLMWPQGGFDPTAGNPLPYTEQDDSVEGRVNAITKSGSPLMQQAAYQGQAAAKRRGLLNSSIAVGAAEDSVIKNALPIASQDASQAFQKNLTNQQFGGQRQLQADSIANQQFMQGKDLAAQDARLAAEIGGQLALQTAKDAAEKERQGIALTAQEAAQVKDLNAAMERLNLQLGSAQTLQTQQITSQETQQQRDLAAKQDMLVQELGSREALQAAQSAAEKERLGLQLTAQEQAQVRDLASAQTRLDQQLASQQALQTQELAARDEMLIKELGSREALQSLQAIADKEKLGMQLTSQEQQQLKELTSLEARADKAIAADKALALLDTDTKKIIATMDDVTRNKTAQLDADTRIAIQNSAISAQSKQNAAEMVVNFGNTYANTYQAIMNNKDIPADARALALEHAYNAYNSNMGLVGQIYTVPLTWPKPAATPAGAITAAPNPQGPQAAPVDPDSKAGKKAAKQAAAAAAAAKKTAASSGSASANYGSSTATPLANKDGFVNYSVNY